MSTKVIESSGNVFADLGLENAEELLLKSKIAMAICAIIKHRGLKQGEAAKILGVKQPHVSALMTGKLYSFSVEKLFHLLNALGRDVEITIKKTPRTREARTVLKAATSYPRKVSTREKRKEKSAA